MSSKVYIGNLEERVNERDLEDGFAFIEFEDPRDADDACRELDGDDTVGVWSCPEAVAKAVKVVAKAVAKVAVVVVDTEEVIVTAGTVEAVMGPVVTGVVDMVAAMEDMTVVMAAA
eukprot:gene24512-29811_t